MMKKFLKFLGYCGVISSILIFLVFGYLYLSYHSEITPRHASQGQNALWARHQWVGEARTPLEYQQLAALLKQHNITDVFFHVGPLDAQGRIPSEKYSFAVTLLQHLRSYYPALRIQAWIGQVEARGGGPLDLSNAAVQQNILSTVKIFLDVGFDGIHYNIEPIYPGDARFIELLRTTRVLTQQRKKILSVSTDELEVFPGMGTLVQMLAKRATLWDKTYYKQVAAHADQIAVMMYDTALPLDWLYGHVVARQTRALLNVLDPETILFMGVPTYEDQRFSFRPEAENIGSGIRGIQKGLTSFPASAITHFGIAIYAEWTTEPDEWDIFTKEWLQ